MTLGRYEILSTLGVGGMGEVYHARDQRLDRSVAIKILPEVVATDTDRLQRFEHEARALSALNHPNLLAIYDVGCEQGTHFLISEYLEGQTLRERIASGPLPRWKTAEYALQLANGLAAAHEKGIIHRDLKPENVFVTRGDRVKILDFGLAKQARAVSAGAESATLSVPNATAVGVVLGTAGYMSPEQVRGQRADHRSDIFSFGAVLYEMTSGKRPFTGGSTVETMNAVLTDEPAELTDPTAAVPPGMERVIRRCLEKAPERRFQSASDLAFAIEALSGSSVVKPVLGVLTPAPRRLQTQLVAALVCVVLLVAGFAGGHLVWPTTPGDVKYQRMTFGRGLIYNARYSSDGQTVIYTAAWDGKRRELFVVRADSPESRPLGIAADRLLAVSRTGEIAVLTHARFLWHYDLVGTLATVPMTGGAPRELMENVRELDYAPDGRSFAVVTRTLGKEHLEFPPGKVLYETTGWISSPRFAPDGKSIAFLDHPMQLDDRGSVKLLALDGSVKTLADGWEAEAGLAWSPDGKEIWFSASDGNTPFLVYAATPAGRRRIVMAHASESRLMDIRNDGTVLFTQSDPRRDLLASIGGEAAERNLSFLNFSNDPILSNDGKILVFEEDSEAEGALYAVCMRKTDGSPVIKLGPGRAVSLSRNARWALAIVFTAPPQLVLLPTGVGERKVLERGNLESYQDGQLLPDGAHVLVTGNEPGRGNRVYVQAITGGAPRPISEENVVAYNHSISPDGKMYVARNGAGEKLVYFVDAAPPRAIPGIRDFEFPLGWTEDGKHIYVYPASDTVMRIDTLDITTGERKPFRTIAPADPAGMLPFRGVDASITPDGKSLVYQVGRQLDSLYAAEGLK